MGLKAMPPPEAESKSTTSDRRGAGIQGMQALHETVLGVYDPAAA